MLLAEDLADPDMCVHLWPDMRPGGVEALGAGLAAGLDDVAMDDVCDVPAAGVEEVEALAMLSPNASVAPSTAAPTAVPTRGLLILTRFSLPGVSPRVAPTGERAG
jgi:hypothetical protein